MPMIIRCEHCKAPLKLPEQYVGKEVRCPSCQKEFVARQELESPPPRPERPAREEVRRDDDSPRRRDDERPSRRPRDDDDRGRPEYEDERPSRRRRDYDDDVPRPRRRYDAGRYIQPHRGGSILAMGIISMVTFCFPILSVSLAIGAIVMANTDNAKMRSGEMDPSGQGQTTAGMVCGIIGLVITVLSFGCFCLGNLGNN
jgi:hypothetical protein